MIEIQIKITKIQIIYVLVKKT